MLHALINLLKKNKRVCKFETSVVLRNKKDWFAEIVNLQPLICVLQEELAFMYEMLGLFEDALIQYDELDALFTQYILFFAAGSMYYICITFVLHITHQVLHTVNQLLFCARNFCEVGKSLIVVNLLTTNKYLTNTCTCLWREIFTIFFSKNCFLTA